MKEREIVRMRKEKLRRMCFHSLLVLKAESLATKLLWINDNVVSLRHWMSLCSLHISASHYVPTSDVLN
jgi:hypothetical protein